MRDCVGVSFFLFHYFLLLLAPPFDRLGCSLFFVAFLGCSWRLHVTCGASALLAPLGCSWFLLALVYSPASSWRPLLFLVLSGTSWLLVGPFLLLPGPPFDRLLRGSSWLLLVPPRYWWRFFSPGASWLLVFPPGAFDKCVPNDVPKV